MAVFGLRKKKKRLLITCVHAKVETWCDKIPSLVSAISSSHPQSSLLNVPSYLLSLLYYIPVWLHCSWNNKLEIWKTYGNNGYLPVSVMDFYRHLAMTVNWEVQKQVALFFYNSIAAAFSILFLSYRAVVWGCCLITVAEWFHSVFSVFFMKVKKKHIQYLWEKVIWKPGS